jgi:hypothetical protein
MEEPTPGSLDGSRQNNSDLRIVLRKLIEAHGADAVKRVLSSIEAATPVENPRSRGRPAGPAIDDLPALREAAAIWRQRGGGPVWPALIAVGETLPGVSESNARRLLSRLLNTERGSHEQFERAGISDFRLATWARKIDRAYTRAGPRYRKAFANAILRIVFSDPDPDMDPVFVGEIRRALPPITLEDMVILTQDSPAAKILPFSLLLYPRPTPYCAFVFGLRVPLDRSGSGTVKLEEVVTRTQDSPAKTFPFRVFPLGDFFYLLPSTPAPLDSSSC